MLVKEFKEEVIYKRATKVTYYDTNGVDISYKPQFILDLLKVIGTSFNVDKSIDIYVLYTE